MATLTPTLTLASTDISSDELSLSVSDSLNITKAVISPSKVALSTGDLTLFAAASYTKSYVYLRNTDDTIAMDIDFGTQLSIQLAAGEFAFFPWESSGNILAKSASGTPYLEYAIFEA
mgnify:FL=1|tara:strand:+ start:175 stop:528 length:354 start_codon:yes stop_codon:yes gene_type:complete